MTGVLEPVLDLERLIVKGLDFTHFTFDETFLFLKNFLA